jgi:hypothetical protein
VNKGTATRERDLPPGKYCMEIRSTEVDEDAKNRVEKCKSRLRSTNGD